MEILPDDLINHTFGYLNITDLLFLSKVSKNIKILIVENSVLFDKLFNNLNIHNAVEIISIIKNSSLFKPLHRSLISTKHFGKNGTIADNILVNIISNQNVYNLSRQLRLNFSSRINISCCNSLDLVKMTKLGGWTSRRINHCIRNILELYNYTNFITLIMLFPYVKYNAWIMISLMNLGKFHILDLLHSRQSFKIKYKSLSRISLESCIKKNYKTSIKWLEDNNYLLTI